MLGLVVSTWFYIYASVKGMLEIHFLRLHPDYWLPKLYFITHYVVIIYKPAVNPLKSRQEGGHFAEDIFERIFLNDNVFKFDQSFTEVCSL